MRYSKSGAKRKRRIETPQHCKFCVNKVEMINYKDVEAIHGFVTKFGKIFGRKRSGFCAKHQRQLTRAVKRARFLALLPFVGSTLKD